MDRHLHWNSVFSTKPSDAVSWFQAKPERSLALIRERVQPPARIVDVGGGDSTLVDALLAEQLGEITVLDISAAALRRSQERLGAQADVVRWIEADITHATLPTAAFDAWHDRAAFHFLTDPADQARYASLAADAIRPQGTLIIATFAADGPLRCSGLDVARYSADTLSQALGAAFTLDDSFTELHHTPTGAEQRFLFAVFRRR